MSHRLLCRLVRVYLSTLAYYVTAAAVKESRISLSHNSLLVTLGLTPPVLPSSPRGDAACRGYSFIPS